MNLLLWRHAEAEDGSPDIARPLSAKGRSQASRVGDWLNRHLPATALVLVSPALRTRQTADALAREYRIEPALAPGAEPARVLAALGGPDVAHRTATVLLVGHQPWIGQTAAQLVTGSPLPWSVRKASVWWLIHRTRTVPSEWILKAVIDSDFL